MARLVNGIPKSLATSQAGDTGDARTSRAGSPIVLPRISLLHVVFEDDHMVVLNKRRVCRPFAPGNYNRHAVNAPALSLRSLPHREGDIGSAGANGAGGIVHRLGQGYLGLMVVARTRSRRSRRCTAQFKNRVVQKKYLALSPGSSRRVRHHRGGHWAVCEGAKKGSACDTASPRERTC